MMRANHSSMADGGCAQVTMSSSCFNPVEDLPGDLAAICLSLVGVRTLLGAAQYVNHAWRNAIDGGLPVVWRDVYLGASELSDAQLVQIAQKSHGNVLSLTQPTWRSARPCSFQVTPQHLNHFCSSTNLRILVIDNFAHDVRLEGTTLSQFPLLEDLCVKGAETIIFPPLQFLHTVQCLYCWCVVGLRNLSAITKLVLRHCAVGESEWPARLRDLTVLDARQYCPKMVDSIASLQHLTHLNTDWSFAYTQQSFFDPPLSFLPGLTTLQRFNMHSILSILHKSFVPYLGAMSFLRELKLKLNGFRISDDDLVCLAPLSNLHHLTISSLKHKQLTGESLSHVARIPNLTSLRIKGYFPDYTHIGLCTQLRELRICNDVSWPSLSLMEVQAISKLQHLTKLVVRIPLFNPCTFSHFCSILSLRELHVCPRNDEPRDTICGFDSLQSNLYLLEVFRVGRITDYALSTKLVDCLVHMPKLRSVCVDMRNRTYEQRKEVEARLRAALPRLDTLSFGD